MITVEQIKAVLRYEPETGNFYWLVARSRRRAGALAGSRYNEYWRVGFGGRIYLAHRLAWFYMTGEWPKMVDHWDTDPLNNRWANLRAADSSKNAANVGPKRCGLKGVTLLPSGSFMAQIKKNGVGHYLGSYRTEAEAHAAYAAKAIELFGEFARVAA